MWSKLIGSRGRYVAWVGGLAGALLALGACGEATPEEVQQRSAPIIERTIEEVQAGVRSASELQSIVELLDGLQMLQGAATVEVTDPDGNEYPAPDGSEYPVPDEASYDWTTDETLAEEVNQFLAQQVFVKENVQDTSPDSVTFLLTGEMVCPESYAVTCAVPGGGEETCETSSSQSEECIDAVNRVQLKVVARLIGSDGLDLELRVGSSPAVWTLHLRSDRVAIDFSLDAAAQAVERIVEVMGEQITLPDTLSGAVSATLIFGTPGELTLQGAVTRAIDVDWLQGGDRYRAQIAASDPVSQLTLRTNPPAIDYAIDWGAIEVLLPAAEVWDGASGPLELVLSGLSASLTADGDDALEVRGLSVGQGTSHLSLDGKPLVKVDLNPDDGRELDLDLIPQQDGSVFRASPLLDLRVDLDLAQVQPYLYEQLEPWLLHESYRLRLAGSGSAEVSVVPETTTTSGMLEVLLGELRLESLVDPATVVVPTGSCMTWQEQTTGHPLLGHLAVGACP
jgi:hypothetical protein